MSIELTCDCGKRLKVSDRLAGRRGKCPACGRVLQIPAQARDEPDEGDALAAEVEAAKQRRNKPQPAATQAPATSTCGGCGKPMGPDAKICIHCGFNKALGDYMPKTNTGMAGDAKENGRRARVRLFGMDASPLKLGLIAGCIAALTGVVTWYSLWGPGRSLHINTVQTVDVVDALHTGETREPFSLFTGQGDRSLGLKATQSKKNPNPGIADVDEVYSVGSNDQLLVLQPDRDGDHVMIEVGLRQSRINDSNSTSRYDNVFSANQWQLRPTGGGPALTPRLMYSSFDEGVEIDLGGADTSSYQKLLPPMKPTDLDVQRGQGFVNGTATWNGPTVKGSVSFSASQSYGGMPAAKGLTGTGQLSIDDPNGIKVDYDYKGGELVVDYDDQSTAWWAKPNFKKPTSMSPWARFEFGLLFERPAQDGKYELVYCDIPLRTVKIVGTAGPAKTAAKTQPQPVATAPAKQRNPNNPLTYFSLLADGRDKARGIVAASNMRQLAIGMQLYMQENGGQFPDNLDRLRGTLGSFDQLLLNPRTKENPGFIYEPPAPNSDPSDTVILHESLNGQPDPNGAKLYADGRIEQ